MTVHLDMMHRRFWSRDGKVSVFYFKIDIDNKDDNVDNDEDNEDDDNGDNDDDDGDDDDDDGDDTTYLCCQRVGQNKVS